jgi:NAD(P)-dependent dehydrogenase (short-subunit alcohol dehydrogenase family)
MKTALITGATSGIGRKTVFELARANLRLVLLARDRDRGNQLVQELKQTTGNSEIELLIADLGSQREIRAAAKQFLDTHAELHILMNNAGLAVRKRTLTEDGIEMTFAVNHLASFLLTNLLLEKLKIAAPSRIINVSSEAHRNVQLDFENLQGEKQFGSFRAYSITKLCNLLFTYELARRLQGTGVTANALHPGYLNTGIFREGGTILKFLVRMTAGKAQTGARALARLALNPELETVSGQYFNGLRISKSTEKSQDPEAAKELWELSERLTALK